MDGQLECPLSAAFVQVLHIMLGDHLKKVTDTAVVYMITTELIAAVDLKVHGKLKAARDGATSKSGASGFTTKHTPGIIALAEKLTEEFNQYGLEKLERKTGLRIIEPSAITAASEVADGGGHHGGRRQVRAPWNMQNMPAAAPAAPAAAAPAPAASITGRRPGFLPNVNRGVVAAAAADGGHSNS